MFAHSRRHSDTSSVYWVVGLRSSWVVVVVLRLSREVGRLLLLMRMVRLWSMNGCGRVGSVLYGLTGGNHYWLLDGVVLTPVRCGHCNGLRRRIGVGGIERHIESERVESKERKVA